MAEFETIVKCPHCGEEFETTVNIEPDCYP